MQLKAVIVGLILLVPVTVFAQQGGECEADLVQALQRSAYQKVLAQQDYEALTRQVQREVLKLRQERDAAVTELAALKATQKAQKPQEIEGK